MVAHDQVAVGPLARWVGWRHAIPSKATGPAGPDRDRPGSRHPRSRGLRGGRGVAEPAAGHHHAPAELGRRPFQAVVRHRRRTGRDAAQGIRARRHARRREPGDDQPVHQPVRQARLEAAAAQPHVWCPWRGRVGASRRRIRCRPGTRPARPHSRSGSGSRTRRSDWASPCSPGWSACPASPSARTIRATSSRASASARASPCSEARIVPPITPTKIPTADPSTGHYACRDPTARAWCW